MTCCEDDISFLGLLCQTNEPANIEGGKWIELEGIIYKKFIKHEQREIPFIAVKDYKYIDKIQEELIYF
jgi:uncharacterized membrane protein YcgQ (UPF0703/DUF1980 family)